MDIIFRTIHLGITCTAKIVSLLSISKNNGQRINSSGNLEILPELKLKFKAIICLFINKNHP